MAVRHAFAPKDKPLGNLPLPASLNTKLGPEWTEFLRCDSPAALGRDQIVLDAQGNHVWQVDLVAGDRAQYGGAFRNEHWRGDNAENAIYMPGETIYAEFAFMLPVGFPVPEGTWGALAQIHTPYTATGAYASPMTVIRPLAGKLRVQNDAEGGIDLETDWMLGHFHYWRWAIQLGRSDIAGKPGHVTVWHDVDRRPLLTDVPVVDKQRNTCPPLAMHTSADGTKTTGSYSKGGLYLPSPSQAAIDAGRTYRHFRDCYVEDPAGLDAVGQLFVQKCRPQALAAPQDTLPLRVLLQAPSYTVVGWDPVSGATGYRMRTDGGSWSHTWDPLIRRDQAFPACNTRFPKTYARIEVEALGVLARGDLP